MYMKPSTTRLCLAYEPMNLEWLVYSSMEILCTCKFPQICFLSTRCCLRGAGRHWKSVELVPDVLPHNSVRQRNLMNHSGVKEKPFLSVYMPLVLVKYGITSVKQVKMKRCQVHWIKPGPSQRNYATFEVDKSTATFLCLENRHLQFPCASVSVFFICKDRTRHHRS